MHENKKISLICIIVFIVIQQAYSLSPLLQPISRTRPPLPDITHPVRPEVQVTQPGPIPTNKFWANFLVSKTGDPVHVHPYAVKLEQNAPFGLAISHAFYLDEKVTGTTPERIAQLNGRIEYYYNVLSSNFGFSATQVSAVTPKAITYHDMFGCILQIGNAGSRIVFPIFRGMAYVTAEYENMTPIIFTINAVLFINGQNSGTVTGRKFSIDLNNGQRWILYVLGGQSITLNFGVNQLISTSLFTGTLKIVRLPKTNQAAAETILDTYSEKWVVGGELDIQTDIDPANPLKASYTFTWKTKGTGELLHYALPHHQDIMTQAQKTDLKLWSTTKGELVGYTGSTWKLVEDGLSHITYLPPRAPDAHRIDAIKAQVTLDIQQFDIYPIIASQSNYWAGKILSKISLLCLLAKELNLGQDLVNQCLSKAKQGIYPYLVNSNPNSLRYEPYWGGVIGHSGINCADGNPYCNQKDYGSSYYNDHHYHYGYFVHAAAIMGYLDKAWLADSKEWIENLVRDVANPSTEDTYFPLFRSFDWFVGHSWSQGLFPQSDGKDQESTSEEICFHYGLMLWGMTTGNKNFEKLGNIMFAIAKRSVQKYFLMKSNNQIHPPKFVENKVTGIFFENKVEYKTWFGPNTEFIHGIQMIPFLPINELVRDYQFVQEEWDTILSKVSLPDSNIWKSILYTNYATLNKDAAWNVISSTTQEMDQGLSRGWALYSIASRYGAPLPPYIPPAITTSSNPIITTSSSSSSIPTTTTSAPARTTTTMSSSTSSSNIPITTSSPQIPTTSNIQIPTTSNIKVPTTSNIQIPTTTSNNHLSTSNNPVPSTKTSTSQSEISSTEDEDSTISIETIFNNDTETTIFNNSTSPPSLNILTLFKSLPDWLFITIIVGVCIVFAAIIGGTVLFILYKKKLLVKKK